MMSAMVARLSALSSVKTRGVKAAKIKVSSLPNMNEISLLIDLHRHQQRQGPGSVEETRRAIHLTGLEYQKDLKIVDIGCGTGGQTLTLAESLDGHITAVDLFPEFLEELESRAAKRGLKNRWW